VLLRRPQPADHPQPRCLQAIVNAKNPPASSVSVDGSAIGNPGAPRVDRL